MYAYIRICVCIYLVMFSLSPVSGSELLGISYMIRTVKVSFVMSELQRL